MQGCFGNYFTEEYEDYCCELCGSHFLEATIGSYNDLFEYSMYVTREYYDDNDGKLTNCDIKKILKHVEDDLCYYKSSFVNNMELCIDGYSISDEDFVKEVERYLKQEGE